MKYREIIAVCSEIMYIETRYGKYQEFLDVIQVTQKNGNFRKTQQKLKIEKL
jgi:hypothetical protein